MTALPARRTAVSALVSAALHTLVLMLTASTTLQIAPDDRTAIPLVIRDPAPPPPPPGGGADVGPPAPAQVAAVEKPEPVVQPVSAPQPQKVEKPKPIEKPKLAAKPKPPARAPATPVAAQAAQPPQRKTGAPAAIAGSGVAGGDAAGVIGGVRGGTAGGKVGGRLGGTGADIFSVDQVAVAPRVLESVRPRYPPIARARGQEGVVVVQAIIDRGGAVEDDSLTILESQNPFDDAALAAFRRWRFQPARDDSGQAVRVLVQQPIRFQLR